MNINNIQENLERNRLKQFGHVKRLEKKYLKKPYNLEMKGKRLIGRLRIQCIDRKKRIQAEGCIGRRELGCWNKKGIYFGI